MSKKTEVTPGEMQDIDVDFISLVRKGANGQSVRIYKADEDGEERAVSGFMQAMKNFFIGKEETATESGAQTISFKDAIAASDLVDNMWRINNALRDVLVKIREDEKITDKNAAMSKVIDEYAEYMKGKVSGGAITKAAFLDEVDDADIAKAGRTLSSKSLSAIQNAITALQGLLSEAEEGSSVEKGEDETMNEDLKTMMKSALDEALSPIQARLESLEKGDTQEEEQGADSILAIVKAAVEEAVSPIQARLDTVEKSRGVGRGMEAEQEGETLEKSDDVFSGFFV